MCAAWTQDFAVFLADMGQCPPGHTLGRIDVDGPYSKENCRWETSHQQARARTDNVWVEHDGERMVLKDFARKVGVPYKGLHAKVRYRGMTLEQAVASYLT